MLWNETLLRDEGVGAIYMKVIKFMHLQLFRWKHKKIVMYHNDFMLLCYILFKVSI